MDDPVAVIGFGLRFPGDATHENAFWNIIIEGKSAMTEVPISRYNIDGFFTGTKSSDSLSCRGGHFIAGDVSAFDAPFFAMSGAEAKSMDPQLRLMLETTYHALENSGLTMEMVRGSLTSVYVGNLTADYSSLFADDEEIRAAYQATGMSGAMLSNRVSWFYDLRGPSMTLDTACSSSLVGLHLACQSILQGETEMSLVGGVRLQLNPTMMTLPLARQNFLSPDSLCYSFDSRANGYSRGEGIGMIVLKRLSKAIVDGNMIRAVIRGTSSNQDGRTPVISQPSCEAQAALIRKAYKDAGLDFKSTRYFEAHGTGTPVGDPIEAEGISKVFSSHLTTESPLYIGSVKSNIGHLESTAGIASVIKAVLVLENGVIPPNALLNCLNPRIRANEWNMRFPTTATPWPASGTRRASVNSFGVGGANAHVVLDDALHYLQSRGLQGRHNTKDFEQDAIRVANCEATKYQMSSMVAKAYTEGSSTQPSLLLPLSAADEDGISRITAALKNHLIGQGNVTASYLQDVAFTLSNCRSQLPWKAYVVGANTRELEQSLSRLPMDPVRASQTPEVMFAFTGQGAQWAEMGIELMGRYHVFQDAIDLADDYFRSLGADWSIIAELHKPASTTKINSPQLAQPICTALQIALVDLLTSWNIIPGAVVGHSSGEIAAAYTLGALSKTSALRVAYYRGEAAMALDDRNTEKGAMLAVALSEDDLAPYMAAVVGNGDVDRLSCGCVNSPISTTATGIESYIDALSDKLDSEHVFNRKLNVPVAYHSTQMLKVADMYRNALIGGLDNGFRDSHVRSPMMISSVTGETTSLNSLKDPEYWIQNLVSKVKFSEALKRISLPSSAQEDNVQSGLKAATYVIEVGPHSALERPIKDILDGEVDFIYNAALRRDISPLTTTQSLVGDLFKNNYPVNIQAFNMSRGVQRCPKMLLDLPLYPFNHSRSYWLESRLSKNRRNRGSPRHDFLGNPSADWNPFKPKWRFTIRASDLPWVVDHKVDGVVLYPGTGFLVMVLEAAKYLTQHSPNLVGFRIRDVRISSALVVPVDEDGIEAQLHMNSQRRFAGQGFQAWDFDIYSISGDDWKLHCSGQVIPEHSEANDIVSQSAQSRSIGDFRKFDSRSPTSRDSSDFYNHLYQRGFHFGANFKSLTNIKVLENESEAMATVKFRDFREEMKRGEVSEHLIHPATLDSLFHVMLAAQYKNGSLPRVVPTHLSEMFVSVSELGNRSMETMILHGKVDESNPFWICGHITATSGSTERLAIAMRGCKFSSLLATDQMGTRSKSTSLFHRMHWKPDIELLSRNHLERYLEEAARNTTTEDGDIKAEIVCRHFLSVALREILRDPKHGVKPHIAKYIEWANRFNIREENSTAALIDEEWPAFKDPDVRLRLIDDWAKLAPWRAKIVMFCENLVQILKGEKDPLDILFNHGVAESIYRSPLLAATTKRLAAYVDLLAHKNSSTTILEVGAGTGSTTSVVLNTLMRQGDSPGASPRFNRYDFTDISPSFFSQAQERYARHASRMLFKVLDIERDPVAQGFKAESYDIIIAAAVLHATADIHQTMSNVKKLLKPGGQLLFSEPTNKSMAVTSGIFGVLPGWWLAKEHHRSEGPLMSSPEWDDAVQRVGLGELQVSLSDNVNNIHMASLLAARLSSPSKSSSSLPTAILIQSSSQLVFAQALQAYLVSNGDACDILTTASLTGMTLAYGYCISLLELHQPILSHLGELQFAGLQHIIRTFKRIVWVTSKCATQPKNPESVIMSGFAKSIMREDPSCTLIYLNINSDEHAAATIARVLDQIKKVPGKLTETDLLEEEGIILIPRVVEAPQINRLLDSAIHGAKPEAVDLVPATTIKEAIELRFTPGRLDSLHFGPETSALRPLLEDEVLISVKATGISSRDVMVALNKLSSVELGREISGIVTEAGAKSGFGPGDRVCALAMSGGFHSYIRARKSQVMTIPQGMSFTEASAIPFAYTTAQYALYHVARLRAGESILIHAASGGVGQAAIQFAQKIGAIVYVTVGTPAKKQFLIERYGIEESRCFSSRNISFMDQLMRQTADKGIDVILSPLSGLALTETWRCMAPFGRYVQVEKHDMVAPESLPMDPFQRNLSYSWVDVTVVAKLNDQLMDKIKNEVQRLVLSETARDFAAPQPITVYKLSEIGNALRWLQTGQNIGKAVVTWERRETIQMIPKSPLDYNFNENSTYLITGGLGGIGRSLAWWMATLGARHLVLLSRSYTKSTAAKELLTKLKDKGVEVYAPSCDISNSNEVKKAVAHVQATMPPIKGCIHGALVVINRIFQDFSWKEFQDNLDPKIKGTWNLHNHLPEDLDFFVMLSSIAGVNGAASQSPYSGASIFQDAFARFRHSQGRHCVSLDLGVVQDVGYVAERVDVARFLAMSMTDHKALTVDELHFMVKYACSPSTRVSSPWDTQVIGALTTPAFIRRHGIVEEHGWMRMPVFCHLYQMEQEDKLVVEAVQTNSVESQLAETKTLNEAAEVITQALAKRLARALTVPIKDIDIGKPPFTFGVDSLIAVELIFWFSNEIRADIPVIQILGNSTVAQLGLHAAEVSGYVPASVRQGTTNTERP